MSALLYHQDFIDFKESKQSKKIFSWIGNNSSVLEFGCHTGLLSKMLKESKDCKVIGVELNGDALDYAKEHQSISIHANIENIDVWKSRVINIKFDNIIFLHVLEHLRNPKEVLESTLNLLKPGGTIIIGLPNISNAKDRFDMLFGKFEYTEIGILDTTHISMFNYFSAKQMIGEVGLTIKDYYSPWQVNPIKGLLDHIPYLWRLAAKVSNKPSQLFKSYPNLTDSVMLFKCKYQNV
jgi:SAM-dependent methyltransferase